MSDSLLLILLSSDLNVRCARIIPLLRLPRAIEIFDYTIPESLDALSVGMVVQMPFRSQAIQGVVESLYESNDTQSLKSITRILSDGVLLCQADRIFLSWFSLYYGISRATAAKLCIHSLPRKKRIALVSAAKNIQLPSFPSERAETLRAAFQNIQDAKKPIVLQCDHWGEKIALYAKLCAHTLEKQGQVLILCPTVNDTTLLRGFLQRYTDAPIWITTGHDSQTTHSALLDSLSHGTPGIIIGTRGAALLPYGAIALVIIDSAERTEHRSNDMDPRYDVRTICTYRFTQTGHTTLFVSAAPRIEEYFQCTQGAMEFISLATPLSFTVCNMKDEFLGGNASGISDILTDELTHTLAAGKNVFLLLNKKGTSRMVVCKTCETLFACTTCSQPLSYSARDASLTCTHCNTHLPIYSSCPTCNGLDFKFIGMGIERLVKRCAVLFPEYPIVEISRDTIARSQQSFMRPSQPTIFIGTSLAPIEFPLLFQSIGLIGIMRADAFYSMNDFRASEQQWQLLQHMKTLAHTYAIRLTLQAFDTDTAWMRWLIDDQYTAFAKNLLSERRSAALPPSTRLISILCRSEKALSQLGVIARKLKELDCTPGISDIIARPDERRVTFTLAIDDYLAPLPSALALYLSELPVGFLIDNDPLIR